MFVGNRGVLVLLKVHPNEAPLNVETASFGVVRREKKGVVLRVVL